MLIDRDRGGPTFQKYLEACETEYNAAHALHEFWVSGAIQDKDETTLGQAVAEAHIMKLLIYKELQQYRRDKRLP